MATMLNINKDGITVGELRKMTEWMQDDWKITVSEYKDKALYSTNVTEIIVDGKHNPCNVELITQMTRDIMDKKK